MDMDPGLYSAAMEGHINVLDQYNSHQFEVQVTPNNNTVLHVAVQFGREQFMAKILEICPSMARHRPNITGDSALHVAVREGYVSIARAILECAKRLDGELESGGGATKELLRATNKVGDTALHMAVRHKWEIVEMVRLLIQEDPEFQHPPNYADETPLYIAAERGYDEVMAECLKNCSSLVVSGPCGRTVLHGAVIKLSPLSGKNYECTKLLLDSDHKYGIDLIKKRDEYGWTPLHYAARNGHSDVAALILKVDKSAAYIGTENDNNTPLHLAAAAGNVGVIRELLSYSPICWEIVNKRGHNFLQVAGDMRQEEVIEYIIEQPIFRLLISHKDKDGNTPLHLLAALRDEKYERMLRKLFFHKEVDLDVFNNQNLTPMDLRDKGYEACYYYGRRNIVEDDFDCIKNRKGRFRLQEVGRIRIQEKKKIEQQNFVEVSKAMQKMGKTHMIVATLITTIAFTAFTIPGGYDDNQDPNQGLAVLVKKTAFVIFYIADTIALVSSIASVILYVTASIYQGATIEDGDAFEHSSNRYGGAFLLIMIAIGALMIAFITGSYAVLTHSRSLSISIIVIGCLPLLIYILEIKKLFSFAKKPDNR